MPSPEIVFKPKYNGSMRFAMILYPVWAGLFIYFGYQFAVTRSFNPQGLLAVIFGLMTISLPLRVFRELRFADQITVKRYLLPDFTIEYKDILEFNVTEIRGRKAGVSLLMMNHDNYKELEQILQRRLAEHKVKLKKRNK